MPQLNLYVSDDLASRLKRDARRAGLPLSRYVASLLAAPAEDVWPESYFEEVCGFLQEELPEPEDRLPETIELETPV
ncbi:MAG TPA: hypothetical protein VKU19_07140 [Bryobacteraceae bacterium]|nr:hypothetical protein [Bryobacteraceae bacterium]